MTFFVYLYFYYNRFIAVNISDKTIRLYGLGDEKIDISPELQFAETVNKDNWNQCCFSQNGDYLIGGSFFFYLKFSLVKNFY